MPLFVSALLGGLINICATLVGRVMVGLGISAVTYTGITASLSYLSSNVFSQFTGLPSTVLAVLGLLKVGSAISLIVSATTWKFAIQGLTSGTMTRWITK
jgi:NO-binding membrane sensor protein with MHYT domain